MNTVSPVPGASQEEAPKGSFLTRWINKARYMTFSAILHLLLILTLGGTVLYESYVEPPDFVAGDNGLMSDEAVSAPPVQEQPALQQADYTPTAPTQAATAQMSSDVVSITTTASTGTSFSASAIAVPNPVKVQAAAPTIGNMPKMSVNMDRKQLGKIANFTGGWAKGGTASFGQPLKQRKFEFTAYLAKYQGGDWDSTIWMDGDQMRGGSLHNLLYVIGHLSKNKILAQAQPVPLDLSSDEIFQKKPPFIFFTGHRDFRLTDKELENLAEYLRVGGCIWGDSSLPGQRSRFDIAFRREMRRLLPDPSIQWAPLPASHPIYTNTYYPEIKSVPPGINFYQEPVYGLTGYGGEIAVIYTANDYGDMWQFGIDEQGQIDLTRDEKRRMIATNEQMWRRRNLYFGNIEPKALFDTYKFGTNIIIHLLTRWEEKIRFAARMGGQ